MMFGSAKSKRAAGGYVASDGHEWGDIAPVADYFRQETGVTFEKQISVLRSKMISFCSVRKISTFAELLERSRCNAAMKQDLVNYLTTNESYFFREFAQIADLVERVKGKMKRVSILCAPSATGEEPYSIAIALLEAGVPPERFSITGIDINSEAVEIARAASYRERHVRNLSPEIRTHYFTREQERYRLRHAVRDLVTFQRANIFDPRFKALGTFDFILSRNMLIYFDKATKSRAKRILESMLKDPADGVMFGHADLL